MLQHKRRCGGSEEIDRNEERFWQISDKVDKNNMTDAEVAAELSGVAGRTKKKRLRCIANR